KDGKSHGEGRLRRGCEGAGEIRVAFPDGRGMGLVIERPHVLRKLAVLVFLDEPTFFGVEVVPVPGTEEDLLPAPHPTVVEHAKVLPGNRRGDALHQAAGHPVLDDATLAAPEEAQETPREILRDLAIKGSKEAPAIEENG